MVGARQPNRWHHHHPSGISRFASTPSSDTILRVNRLDPSAVLRGLSATRSLSRDAQIDLLDWAEERSYAVGEQLFAEGDPSDVMYLLLRGLVEVTTCEPNGEQLPLGRVKAGEIIGEMGLFDDAPRSGTATCLQPVLALAVSRELYRTLADNDDELAYWMLRIIADGMAKRVGAMTERIAAARLNPDILRHIPEDPQERARRWWEVLSLWRRG